MNNNDVFKKLRVALQLRDDQIIEILNLVNFRVSKGELGNIFRSEDHSNYMECGDQLLRNFLNGLVIYLRGTKEDPHLVTLLAGRRCRWLRIERRIERRRYPGHGQLSRPGPHRGRTARRPGYGLQHDSGQASVEPARDLPGDRR